MEIFVLIILILINGFFALSEIALVSSKRAILEHKKAHGNKEAKKALKLLNNSENFLSAIQVGITLIGIVTGVYGGMNIADDVTPFIQQFEPLTQYSSDIALVLTVLVITYFSIVIGELVPKTIALSNPDRIAIAIAPTIYYFSAAFYPFVRLLSLSTLFVNKMLGIKKQSEQMTEAELRQIIKLASFEGVIEKEQNTIHEKIFYFADKKAKHIMTHRTEIEWIDINRPVEQIKNTLYNSEHSKIICCNGNLDNVVGILQISDYFKKISTANNSSIQELISEPLLVPESMDAQKVLALLRQHTTRFCCVINEYGGLAGLITLHNIIENIVGQIPDEGELYEPDVFVRDDNSLLVSGDAPIETLTDIITDFSVDFEQINYSTVAGFVIDNLKTLPHIGDKIVYNNFIIEIVDIDGNKIDKLLISKIEN
ncbi:MAG: HlyC/CorC family transporter [Breznakibacter sp.]|nr:HlyC/CorC family transporter [Breznakibacter sp.]